jgi:hypothetical protein
MARSFAGFEPDGGLDAPLTSLYLAGHMARYSTPTHDLHPVLTGWSACAGMGRIGAAALITNQPRGY